MNIKALLIAVAVFIIFVIIVAVITVLAKLCPIALFSLIGIFVFGIIYRIALDMIGGGR
jgi:hypothetical protein